MNTNTTEHAHTENNPVIDEMFEQAALNQDFESLAELAEVSSWLSNEIDPASIASNMNDPSSAPMVPKPEFKERFEAWLEAKRSK
jgi:hypothetical protein